MIDHFYTRPVESIFPCWTTWSTTIFQPNQSSLFTEWVSNMAVLKCPLLFQLVLKFCWKNVFVSSGRVARAGRSGTAYSIVAGDEVRTYKYITHWCNLKSVGKQVPILFRWESNSSITEHNKHLPHHAALHCIAMYHTIPRHTASHHSTHHTPHHTTPYHTIP